MASNPRPKLSTTQLPRATPETKFFVDYDWWEKSSLDLRTYLFTRLSIEEEALPNMETDEIDLVDMKTGQVRRVDGFQYAIQTYFQQLPDDFVTRTSLVDAIFCVLLANANEPMTAQELADRIRRSPEVVLKTIGGPRIYQGIRPIFEEEK